MGGLEELVIATFVHGAAFTRSFTHSYLVERVEWQATLDRERYGEMLGETVVPP